MTLEKNNLAKINKVIGHAQLAIQSHGGDIELVDYKNNIVYIKLTGACIGCPMSILTVKLGIEAQLKDEIPSLLKVVVFLLENLREH